MTFKDSMSDAYCECLFFLDDRGRIFLPPFNYYHPTVFHPDCSESGTYKVTEQWLRVADEMVKGMRKVGCAEDYVLPPEFQDIRPWRWRHFITGVRYSYRVKLPHDVNLIDHAVKQRIKKATSEGYVTRVADSMSDVYECLVATEKRKGFSHRLSLEDLEYAASSLGDDLFRAYVCYSKDGEPASASIEIILGNKNALGLVAGSKENHLRNGTAQHLRAYMFQDLVAHGVESFDFCGANIPSVAEAKAQWGAELVPYYTVRKRRLQDVAKEGGKWLQSIIQRNEARKL